MTINELKELARHAIGRTAPENYTVDTVDAAVADGFKQLTSSINDFMRNRYDIYSIITENADTVVPQKVMEQFGVFADIRNAAQGDRVSFKRGTGRSRARKFLTQVGLSGVYETFRLDSETFTLPTKAIGGAVTLDFERMLDGNESLAEFMAVLADVQVEAIYGEIQAALIAAVSNTAMPSRNRVSGTYSAESMQKLVNTVKMYGTGAVIFASPEFVAAMGPDVIAPVGTYTASTSIMRTMANQEDVSDIHNFGRIRIFRGTPVVELRQSFADETNEQVMINPQYAYVLPTGGPNDKVVKIVMEGQTQIYDNNNRDNSIEVNTYRKIGVGIASYNNWGVYQNTGISADDWYNSAV